MSETAITLEELYDPITAELAQSKQRFDEELVSQLPFVNSLCQRVRNYRGKMLRPTLLLLTAKACGECLDEHITLAAVVEMVHVATLVHDDVLDEADTRRKMATIRATDGNQPAVLLGDYLISHAFHLCSELNDQAASRLIGATTNAVCEGELMQIHHRGDTTLDEATYLEIITRKTAALTGICCALGAGHAGVDPDGVAAWDRFGRDVGIAFQIIDDVLDYVGDEQQMGKTLGRDLELGKSTLPTIHAMTHAEPSVRAELSAALTSGQPVSRERMGEMLRTCGSIEYAYDQAGQYVSSAQQHLQELAPGPARDALGIATDFIISRRK